MENHMETEVCTEVPTAIGPYSQFKVIGNIVYTSGQIPVDPHSGAIVGGDIRSQTSRVLKNLEAVLKCAQTSLQKVVKTTCYLTDMEHFSSFNEVYNDYFCDVKPVRSCVAVRTLPKNVLVEIDAIAEAE